MTARNPIHPVLVTGGAGFIGSNLADRLAAEGEHVLIFDALARPGVEANLAWLKKGNPRRISSIVADIRDPDAVSEATSKAKAVFHLAAQVAVTTSLVDPYEDFAVNLGGTLNVLEALRTRGGHTPLVFASTNKVYGDLADIALRQDAVTRKHVPADAAVAQAGLGEDRPLDFHTPYGCSKGAADQYVLDYARSFGLPTAVMRMSCIYGPRQMGTEDQGWVAHFAKRALADEPIAIYGDGFQVRDVLYVADAVDAYVAAWRRIDRVKGRAFNLGGGPENAVSLLQLTACLEQVLDRPIALRFFDWRAGDQRYYVSDVRAARAALGIGRPTPWREGVARLCRWLQDDAAPARRTRAAKRAAGPVEARL